MLHVLQGLGPSGDPVTNDYDTYDGRLGSQLSSPHDLKSVAPPA